MTNTSMFSSVTPLAERYQVLKSMVAFVFGRGSTFAINVVHLKQFVCSAMLTLVSVTLQGLISVASKVVVVFGCLAVFGKSLGIRCKPLMNFADLFAFLAWSTSLLWASLVFKLCSAVSAVALGANRGCASFESKLPQGLGVSQFSKFHSAWFASLLRRTYRLKSDGAHGAGLWLVRHSNPLIKCLRIVA
jgi:hypothetical protein